MCACVGSPLPSWKVGGMEGVTVFCEQHMFLVTDKRKFILSLGWRWMNYKSSQMQRIVSACRLQFQKEREATTKPLDISHIVLEMFYLWVLL